MIQRYTTYKCNALLITVTSLILRNITSNKVTNLVIIDWVTSSHNKAYWMKLILAIYTLSSGNPEVSRKWSRSNRNTLIEHSITLIKQSWHSLLCVHKVVTFYKYLTQPWLYKCTCLSRGITGVDLGACKRKCTSRLSCKWLRKPDYLHSFQV